MQRFFIEFKIPSVLYPFALRFLDFYCVWQRNFKTHDVLVMSIIILVLKIAYPVELNNSLSPVDTIPSNIV